MSSIKVGDEVIVARPYPGDVANFEAGERGNVKRIHGSGEETYATITRQGGGETTRLLSRLDLVKPAVRGSVGAPTIVPDNPNAQSLEASWWQLFGPYPIKHTPFALDHANRMNATKWIMRRQGEMWVKDEKLTTELHHRFGDRKRFDQEPTLPREIADWLREVHAAEQKAERTLEFEAEVGDRRLTDALYDNFNYNKMPYGSRVKVTIERLDK